MTAVKRLGRPVICCGGNAGTLAAGVGPGTRRASGPTAPGVSDVRSKRPGGCADAARLAYCGRGGTGRAMSANKGGDGTDRPAITGGPIVATLVCGRAFSLMSSSILVFTSAALGIVFGGQPAAHEDDTGGREEYASAACDP